MRHFAKVWQYLHKWITFLLPRTAGKLTFKYEYTYPKGEKSNKISNAHHLF
jgi:hypothetical protein